MSEQPVIRAVNLHQKYTVGAQTLHVLKGVSFEVFRGESVFLLGASGAGKTTLLYCLAGLENPKEGEVFVDGLSLYEMSKRRRAEVRNLKMGFIFQHYFLLPELTALENVLLPSLIRRDPAKQRAIELLERVGLKDRMMHLPAELSGGEQQRVAIARALINNPSLIIADEPTGNLDSKNGLDLMTLLLALAKETGKTLVVVTHDQELSKLGDRHIRLVDGQMAQDAFVADPSV